MVTGVIGVRCNFLFSSSFSGITGKGNETNLLGEGTYTHDIFNHTGRVLTSDSYVN